MFLLAKEAGETTQLYGVLEDIRISGLTMRDVRNAPLFIRLGARLNAPPLAASACPESTGQEA